MRLLYRLIRIFNYYDIPRLAFHLMAFSGLLIATTAPYLHAELVRRPAVAGTFYSANPKKLASDIDRYLANVSPSSPKYAPRILIVPHAGYVFSAQTAAYAFALLKGQPIETVILIGNSHRFQLDEAAVYPSGVFQTPLGEVRVDKYLAAELIGASPFISANTTAHIGEHSLEVEIPFIQRVLPNAKIVPILMGQFPHSTRREIGMTIGSLLSRTGRDKNTIIVTSTDLSHYPKHDDAMQLDAITAHAIAAGNPLQLQNTIDALMRHAPDNTSCAACAEDSIVITLYAARQLGLSHGTILHTSNSSGASGDPSRVVGYASIVFTDKKASSNKEDTMNEFTITKENQKTLLRIARETITEHVTHGKTPSCTSHDPAMVEPAAVFVTLEKNGMLRGCIGTVTPQQPLYQAVKHFSIAAATDDPRFPPVSPDELNSIHIEISVLSPMKRVKSADEVLQNTHGVMIVRGGRSGLFLPQVWEHFTTKDDFLGELCTQKAGLSRTAWKDPETEIYVFTVCAFEE